MVALGARPELGEGIVAGDVVNTASRLQGVAPVDGVAVSEQTYRQTERVFEYEPLEPVAVKGKSEPLPIFRPLRARAEFGRDVIRTHTTPLVGRDLEQSLLIGTFERADQQRSCQLATLVGEPGVGKSRMCAELLRHVDARRDLIRWRQGRCLPYGDGIAFWALGEIVKAECGILESDTPSEASAKLGQTIPDGDPERAWLLARLAPLVGAPAEPAGQEESFAAWRRFCEGLAAERTTVLVLEDLHWADPALLAFLEHLADWAEGVPLLLPLHSAAGAVRAASDLRRQRSKRAADQPRSVERYGDRPAGLGAAGAGGAAGRDATGAAGASGRQSPLRRGVRASAGRPRAAR